MIRYSDSANAGWAFLALLLVASAVDRLTGQDGAAAVVVLGGSALGGIVALVYDFLQDRRRCESPPR